MRILRRENYRLTRWKNGGGETAEIAVSPDNSGLDDFDWRISMATVASDGPFSAFPGVDRTLSVLEGAGIVLEVEGNAPATLTPGSQPFSFAAGAAAGARLLDGTITDLNVMTRRGRFVHRVERCAVEGMLEVAPGSMVFAASGGLRVAGCVYDAEIGSFDMVLPEDQGLSIAGHGLVYLIGIDTLQDIS
jgi:environmental stress-induced protein Ves